MEIAKLLSIAPSLSIGLFAVALRYRVTYSWSHPSVIFSVFWFALTILPLLAVWSMPIQPLAVLYIMGAVVAFGAPAFFVDWKQAVEASTKRKAEQSPSIELVALFYLMQAVVVVTIVQNLYFQGYSLGPYFTDPLRAATQYLNASSDGNTKPFLLSTFGFILLYAAAAIGGFTISREPTALRRTVLFAAVFLPSIMHIWLYSLKGTIFLAGAIFFAGVLAARVQRGDLSLVNKATLKVALGLAVPVIALLAFAMLARPGRGLWGADEQGRKVLYYLSSYAFGHLYAFSDWFSSYLLGGGTTQYTDPDQPTLGFWTFMSIGKYINPDYQMPPGYFDEYFGVDKVLNTNIYTAFRGMIYDFTWFGSLIFMTIFGAVSTFSYHRMLIRPVPFISQSVFIFLVGWMYQSYIISMFIWPTTIAAGAVTAAVLGGCVVFRNRTISAPI